MCQTLRECMQGVEYIHIYMHVFNTRKYGPGDRVGSGGGDRIPPGGLGGGGGGGGPYSLREYGPLDRKLGQTVYPMTPATILEAQIIFLRDTAGCLKL